MVDQVLARVVHRAAPMEVVAERRDVARDGEQHELLAALAHGQVEVLASGDDVRNASLATSHAEDIESHAAELNQAAPSSDRDGEQPAGQTNLDQA